MRVFCSFKTGRAGVDPPAFSFRLDRPILEGCEVKVVGDDVAAFEPRAHFQRINTCHKMILARKRFGKVLLLCRRRTRQDDRLGLRLSLQIWHKKFLHIWRVICVQRELGRAEIMPLRAKIL